MMPSFVFMYSIFQRGQLGGPRPAPNCYWSGRICNEVLTSEWTRRRGRSNRPSSAVRLVFKWADQDSCWYCRAVWSLHRGHVDRQFIGALRKSCVGDATDGVAAARSGAVGDALIRRPRPTSSTGGGPGDSASDKWPRGSSRLGCHQTPPRVHAGSRNCVDLEPQKCHWISQVFLIIWLNVRVVRRTKKQDMGNPS